MKATKKAKAPEQTPQERVDEFAQLVQAASDKTGIGLGLRMVYNPEGTKPDLYYVDLTAKKNEQK